MTLDIEKVHPSRITEKLSEIRGSNQKTSYLESLLMQIPDEQPSDVQQFTNLNEFFDLDSHALVAGRTGYGKTSLMLDIMLQFMSRGTKVFYREPAEEFFYLAKYIPTQVFIPEQSDISLEMIGFNAEVVKTNNPRTIVEKMYENNYMFNVMLYDAYTLESKFTAEFFSEVFKQLMHYCQQKRKSQRQEIIFSIDELNDFVTPRGKGLTPMHTELAKHFDSCIRKFRKYKVRLFASTQRFNQISIDVRSQFDTTFIKRCFGYDIWTFIAHQLITSNNKTFWKTIRHVIGMPVNEFLYFDRHGKFDYYKISDIKRPNVEIEPLGEWFGIPKIKKGKKVTYDRYERDIKLGYLIGKGIRNKDLPKYFDNMTANYINRITHDLRSSKLIEFDETSENTPENQEV